MNVLVFETCRAKNKTSDISWSIFIQIASVLFYSGATYRRRLIYFRHFALWNILHMFYGMKNDSKLHFISKFLKHLENSLKLQSVRFLCLWERQRERERKKGERWWKTSGKVSQIICVLCETVWLNRTRAYVLWSKVSRSVFPRNESVTLAVVTVNIEVAGRVHFAFTDSGF